MRIEINISKKHFYILFTLLSVLGLVIGVTAYNEGDNPIIGGHTVGEIDWSQPIPSDIEVDGNIEADGDVCNGEERCIGEPDFEVTRFCPTNKGSDNCHIRLSKGRSIDLGEHDFCALAASGSNEENHAVELSKSGNSWVLANVGGNYAFAKAYCIDFF